MSAFIWWIVIGIAAGAIAGWLMKGKGFGFIVNLIVGLVGGFIGGFVFDLLGITFGGTFGSLITAVVGAVLLIWVVSLFKK